MHTCVQMRVGTRPRECVFVCACAYARRLLVGAPLARTGDQRTGDVFRCPVDHGNSSGACSRLHLGEPRGPKLRPLPDDLLTCCHVTRKRVRGPRAGAAERRHEAGNDAHRGSQRRKLCGESCEHTKSDECRRADAHRHASMLTRTDAKSLTTRRCRRQTCGPRWSHECGSSLYTSGMCARVGARFQMLGAVTPAFQRCETFVDLVMVVDGSNSIYPWGDVRDFLINVLNKFNIGPSQTQVGVLQYGSKVVHEFRLGEHRTVEEVLAAAGDIRQRGGEETRTALAINVARSQAFERGGRPGAHKVLVVITDGESHDNPRLDDAVRRCKRDNITMYAIAVLGYYNRRGVNPEAFLKEIRFIASDPDEDHFFNVTDEAALKDIVDALGERIFTLEGSGGTGRGFGLQMAQAGFSSHLLQDGLLVGVVGAYDWNGAVLKQSPHGNLLLAQAAYGDQFPEELRNHAAYLGYSLGSLVPTGASRDEILVAGAPRFNHSGKVVAFTLDRRGHVDVLQALLGEQMGSYYGSVLLSMDVDGDSRSDLLLVAAPMYCSHDAHETGKVYIHTLDTHAKAPLALQGALLPSPARNSRFGSALAQIPDVNADGFNDLAVGAPLEDDHRGALYLYHGHRRSIRAHHTQRLAAVSLDSGLKYFGQSLHAAEDGDGLGNVAVGALGAAVIVRCRQVVRLESTLTFEPAKVNVFRKGCQRAGRAVACMVAVVCLRLRGATADTRDAAHRVAVRYQLSLDEKRFPHRAVLDDREQLQTKTMTLTTGSQQCRRHGFTVQDTMDYGRPITAGLEAGLWSSEDGPMLDPDWPTTLKAELPFWNGCAREDACVPDLIIDTHTDLTGVRQLCSSPEEAWRSVCGQQGTPQAAGAFVVDTRRRRAAFFARLENRGENAYGTSVLISSSRNLVFASLVVKDQSDVRMECFSEEANRRRCNISAPFMKASSQVFFRVEFEFSSLVFLDHLWLAMAAGSEGEDASPDDNDAEITLALKYRTDIVFTADQSPSRFVVRSESLASPGDEDDEDEDDVFPSFNVSFYLENLSWFPVDGVSFRADLWAVSLHGNRLLSLTHCGLGRDRDQAAASCVLTQPAAADQATAEDLTHLTQMVGARTCARLHEPKVTLRACLVQNASNSASVSADCKLFLPASDRVTLTLRGKLRRPVLQKVVFRTLRVLLSADVRLDSSGPFFLQQERPVRQTFVELKKEHKSGAILLIVILGSSAAGFLALAIIVLTLWRLGFFSRKRRSLAQEEPAAANGKPADVL
ncbi:integrin alpha-11-like isoform X2 [Phycodurus eques]|uniref:integrin alpha-11-like isoform X2 n=1 Tax=Phycodurus eques TaxID=693459 RepID=UPI002ACE5078|nr:integrin alpha-11-like isoform X2 [Phycodurus eques]